jgi:predicted SAM-dependent methyltransferase
MSLLTAPSGHQLLLIYRTDFLFYTPERRRLATEWNHVRLTSAAVQEPNVINHRLDQPLPFADSTFDAIYAFHVVEHLDLRSNERFVVDLHRLLKPGAICRISTPDLEFHASEYLHCLRAYAANESAENYGRYQWAVCNLIDQSAREVSGGEMLEVIKRGEFVDEYVKYMNGDLLYFLFPPSVSRDSRRRPISPDLTRPGRLLRRIVRGILRRLPFRRPYLSYLELTHERNLWLFDRVSLPRLLSLANFRDITIRNYQTSTIPEWARYNFDESAFGRYPLEPSLYIEATK